MHSTMHSPRSSCTENIEFIGDVGDTVVACRSCYGYLLCAESPTTLTTFLNRCITGGLVIVYGELGPKKVRPAQVVFNNILTK